MRKTKALRTRAETYRSPFALNDTKFWDEWLFHEAAAKPIARSLAKAIARVFPAIFA